MNKDVIYIDVEDDITAIIGKIKDSKEKIVALVPPKRVGVLQSAVNLRLLDRMATTAHKHLVLITNNQALIGLSASAGIPVAKNLQSKPELAEISALEVDDGEDVIDGAQLPVGELEKTSDTPVKSPVYSPSTSKDDAVNDTVGSLNIDDLEVPISGVAAGKESTSSVVKKAKAKSKVPNFDRFRRRLFIVIAAVILLTGFLIWANVFAPAATIIITARTTPEDISDSVTVGDTLTTSLSASTIQSVTKSVQKSSSVTFTPTGSQNIGNKATAQIDYSNSSLSSQSIAAGTSLTTSSGLVFTTDSAVTVPAASFPCGTTHCPTNGTTSGSATAAAGGANYNGASGSLAGAPGNVSATFDSPSAGGTDKIVTIVTSDDIAKATAQLTTPSTSSTSSIQSQLEKEFSASQIVINGSFANTTATPVSSPALNAQATGTASLTAITTYTLSAVSKSDIQSFLDSSINSQIGTTKDQRIYDDGISKVSFQDYSAGASGNTMTIVSTGQIGPNIDQTAVKKQAEGQIYGVVQSNLSAINGVDNVDIKFSYFWVSKVPNDPNKIKIQFQIDNND